ncbi:MAG TPA: phage holin family protein [Burkholderiaceae bacterium]|nr:phage holin family protein [Burkholderiaceae bacterium]
MAVEKSEKSLAALFSDLTRDTVELVRQEIALARAELSQKVTTAQTALASMAVGAAVILAGLFLLLQAVVAGVAMILPPEIAPWLAPLLVGAIVAAIGWAMLKGGKAKLDSDHLMPQRTMDSLRRDKAVVQEKTR